MLRTYVYRNEILYRMYVNCNYTGMIISNYYAQLHMLFVKEFTNFNHTSYITRQPTPPSQLYTISDPPRTHCISLTLRDAHSERARPHCLPAYLWGWGGHERRQTPQVHTYGSTTILKFSPHSHVLNPDFEFCVVLMQLLHEFTTVHHCRQYQSLLK